MNICILEKFLLQKLIHRFHGNIGHILILLLFRRKIPPMPSMLYRRNDVSTSNFPQSSRKTSPSGLASKYEENHSLILSNVTSNPEDVKRRIKKDNPPSWWLNFFHEIFSYSPPVEAKLGVVGHSAWARTNSLLWRITIRRKERKSKESSFWFLFHLLSRSVLHIFI